LTVHPPEAHALTTTSARLTDVVSELRDFAITTFDVSVERLARHLPEGIEAEPFEVHGASCARISAVTFRNLDFHVGFAPFVRIDAPQTNFRAYVRVAGKPAVYFVGTSFGSISVAIPRFVWGLPWRRATHTIACSFDGDGQCARYGWSAASDFGEETLEATGTGEPAGALEGFADATATARILADPTIGFVTLRSGRVATYGVDHPPLVLERAQANAARFEWFERLDLIDVGQSPSSVLVTPRSRFIVRLPPKRIELAR